MRLRATSLLLFGLAALVVWGCGRSGVPGPVGPTPTGTLTPTPSPTPTTDPDVLFTSVTSTTTSVRPGQFGISVVAELSNTGTTPIEEVYAVLTFSDVSGSRAGEFDQREADFRDASGFGIPPSRTMVAGTTLTLTFNMDVMPWVGTTNVEVNAAATFRRGSDSFSATPAASAHAIAVPDVTEYVVTETADEDDGGGDNDLSLREALLDAQTAGVHRIRFDPGVFSPTAPGRITLTDALGSLPPLGTTVILDGHDSGVEIYAGDSLSDERRYGLDIRGTGVVVSELRFIHPSVFFPIETLSNNCGANAPTGGNGEAIHVEGAAQDVILFRNVFYDGQTVFERSCYPAVVRFFGGAGHRIVGNDFYDLAMDAIYLSNTSVEEITGNRMAAAAGSTISDEGIYIADLNADLFVIGNLIVDQEFAGVAASGAGSEIVYVFNNTFVRSLGSGINRAGATRPLVLRNNIWAGNEPSNVSGGTTANLNYAYELISDDDPLCSACSVTTTQLFSDPMFAIAGSNSWIALTPQSGSPAIDSGTDLLDRNGAAPGRFRGAGVDRGAVETGSD